MRSICKPLTILALAAALVGTAQAFDTPVVLSASYLMVHPRCQIYPTPSGNRALINGAVVDPVTHKPVGGAVRVVEGSYGATRVTTDADGLFALTVPATGKNPRFTVLGSGSADIRLTCRPVPVS
jgi:hypothetical protein